MKPSLTILLTTSAMALSGCDFFTDLLNDLSGTTLVTEQVTLQPSIFGLHSRSARYFSPDICFPGSVDRRGTASNAFASWSGRDGPDVGAIMVGYENFTLEGQSCVPQFSRIFQGKVMFDLDALPEGAIIQSSELSFDRRNNFVSANGVQEGYYCRRGDERDPGGAGFIEAGVPSSPLDANEISGIFGLPDDRVVDNNLIEYTGAFNFPSGINPNSNIYRSETVDVTRLSQRAMRRVVKDFELVLSPDPYWIDRPIDFEEEGTRAIHCVNYYQNMQLTVEYQRPVRE